MKTFFANLDSDIRNGLIEQLRVLWTHSSTALEGNTLTLGETAFILKEGLTVSGKPLKDHEEVVGHAKAIDLLYDMLDKKDITEQDLFALHKAIQTEKVIDIYHPVGDWKKENNGTFCIDENDKQVFINYVEPTKVPALMSCWLKMLNEDKNDLTKEQALDIYAKIHISFVSIHPFADGNGRMARLLCNIPVLRANLPPILISQQSRFEYIKILSSYQLTTEQPTKENLVSGNIQSFKNFLVEEWNNSIELIETAYNEQEKRNETHTQ